MFTHSELSAAAISTATHMNTLTEEFENHALIIGTLIFSLAEVVGQDYAINWLEVLIEELKDNSVPSANDN